MARRPAWPEGLISCSAQQPLAQRAPAPRPQPGPRPGKWHPAWAAFNPTVLSRRWRSDGRPRPAEDQKAPAAAVPLKTLVQFCLPFSPSALLTPPASRRKGARRTGARKKERSAGEDGAAVRPFAGARVRLRAAPSNGLATGALLVRVRTRARAQDSSGAAP